MPIHPTSKDFPAHAKPAIPTIEEMGFTAYFDPRFPLPEQNKRVQVRYERNQAPKTEVSRYAVAMANGNLFPPIIVTEDGFIVDGNTRVGARRKLGEKYIEALVLDTKNDPSVAPALSMLGATFNIMNGRTIEKSEIRRVIQDFGERYEYNSETVARRLNVPVSLVKGYFAEDRALKRIDVLKLKAPNLGAMYLRAIGGASAWLHDAPFIAIVELCRDSGMPTKEVGGLLKRVKAASSDSAALEILKAERSLRKEQIRQFKATGVKAKPPMSAQFRQSMGLVLNNRHRVKMFVDTNPYTSGTRLEQIDDFLSLVMQIRDAQAEQAAFDQANAMRAAE